MPTQTVDNARIVAIEKKLDDNAKKLDIIINHLANPHNSKGSDDVPSQPSTTQSSLSGFASADVAGPRSRYETDGTGRTSPHRNGISTSQSRVLSTEKNPMNRNSSSSLQSSHEGPTKSMLGAIKERSDAKQPYIVLNDSDAWMINPKNQFRMTWDIGLIMPFLLYLTIVMPFRLCFANEAPQFTIFYWFEFMIDMVFIMDIFFNFRTGLIIDLSDDPAAVAANGIGEGDLEIVEYDRWRVAVSYFQSWFFLDVISGIPFALLELLMANSNPGALKGAKILKLLRFLKLGRLLKFDKILSNLDRETNDRIADFLAAGATRSFVMMVRLMLSLGYVVHIMACGFVLVGRTGSLENQDSWLAYELDGPYEAYDTTVAPSSFSIYVAAFYFCLTTMTSVGYGDIITRNNRERLYVIALQFLGAIVFATIVASITAVVTSMDINARATAEQLDAVSSFVLNKKFPDSLGRRVRRHFRHYYSLKSAIDESKIFSELSSSLRKEVSAFMISELMGEKSFFMTLRSTLWPKLLPMLRPMRFEAGEMVCKQGEECTEMYVVLTGTLLGSTEVPDERFPRTRHVDLGMSVNILHALGVWHECVETVHAVTSVDTYAVSFSDMETLFQAKSEKADYERLRRNEASRFRMEANEDAPTPYGRPLYYSCFSGVEIVLGGSAVLQAKPSPLALGFSPNRFASVRKSQQNNERKVSSQQDTLAEGVWSASGEPMAGGGPRKRPSMWAGRHALEEKLAPGPCQLVVLDLVDPLTERPLAEIWKHKSGRASEQVRDDLLDGGGGGGGFGKCACAWFGDAVQWSDVTVPLEAAALRVQVFSLAHAVPGDDRNLPPHQVAAAAAKGHGKELLVGKRVVRLAELEAEAMARAAASTHSPANQRTGSARVSKASQASARDARGSRASHGAVSSALAPSGAANGAAAAPLTTSGGGGSLAGGALELEWARAGLKRGGPLRAGEIETWLDLEPPGGWTSSGDRTPALLPPGSGGDGGGDELSFGAGLLSSAVSATSPRARSRKGGAGGAAHGAGGDRTPGAPPASVFLRIRVRRPEGSPEGGGPGGDPATGGGPWWVRGDSKAAAGPAVVPAVVQHPPKAPSVASSAASPSANTNSQKRRPPRGRSREETALI